MQKNISLKTAIALLLLLGFSCVNEDAEPPGCEAPPVPTIVAPVTTFREGQTATLNAEAPEGETGGSFEWTGPNNYLSFNDNAVLGRVSVKNTGEYKLYYLDENNCRSQPASVFIALNSENATCGLAANKVYVLPNNFVAIQKINEINIDGKFGLEVNQSDIGVQVKFPVAERPVSNTLYKISGNSASLAGDEIDIKLFYGGEWYRAQNTGKKVQVFLENNAQLYIVLCENTFESTTQPGKIITVSFNILSV